MRRFSKRLAVCFRTLFLGIAVMFAQPSIAATISVIQGVASDQKGILISGPIEAGDDNKFFELAREIPRATVLLESPGGLVDVGISIAAEIAIRGYTTLVVKGDGCHSICAIIWVAGERRYMTPNADISVHAAYRMKADALGGFTTSESGVANAQIGAFLNQIGLSADAVRYFTFARPSEELLRITPEVAQLLSLDVYIQTGSGVIPPSERPTPRRITRQVSEFVGLSQNCGNLFGVNPSLWERLSRSLLEEGHNLFGGEVFSPLLGEYVASTKAEISRLGIVRWCISAEKNLRDNGLPTGIFGPSYNCGKAAADSEIAICGSRDLWALDQAMANIYLAFRKSTNSDDSQSILSTQRAWLVRRNNCGSNESCLLERYYSRLFDFGVW